MVRRIRFSAPLIALFVLVGWSCKDSNPSTPPAPLAAESMDNVHYGADLLQVIRPDKLLPATSRGVAVKEPCHRPERWSRGTSPTQTPPPQESEGAGRAEMTDLTPHHSWRAMPIARTQRNAA